MGNFPYRGIVIDLYRTDRKKLVMTPEQQIMQLKIEISRLARLLTCSVVKERDFWKKKYEESEKKYKELIEEKRRELTG